MKNPWIDFGADGSIDWTLVEREFPHAAAMAACMQDPVFHSEGDVLTHTRMVLHELSSDPEFHEMSPERRNAVALAALWHDAAKPETREEVFDSDLGRLRVSHPHHAAKGAMHAWRDLWRFGIPIDVRLDVFAMIMGHQQIFRVLKKSDPRIDLARLSTLGSIYELTMLAKADNRGRICPDKRVADDEMDLVRMAADENGCLHQPWAFASPQARLRFARGAKDSLFFAPPAPTGSRLIVLSGLPGSGKDTYFERRLSGYAHVSLDIIRKKLGVEASENQGRVAQEAIEACRRHLRKKEPFVFNATNLTRLQRAKIVTLAVSYDAHVEIHAMEAAPDVRDRNNRGRRDPVPDGIVSRMIEKWEPPTNLEAHDVVWIGADLEPIPDIRAIPRGPTTGSPLNP